MFGREFVCDSAQIRFDWRLVTNRINKVMEFRMSDVMVVTIRQVENNSRDDNGMVLCY